MRECLRAETTTEFVADFSFFLAHSACFRALAHARGARMPAAPQISLAHDLQIGECKHHQRLARFLGQAPITSLAMLELALGGPNVHPTFARMLALIFSNCSLSRLPDLPVSIALRWTGIAALCEATSGWCACSSSRLRTLR